MAAGLSFAVKAATLLPRAGIQSGSKVLSSPTIWAALTKGAADGVAYGDLQLTAESQLQITVDINEARLASTAAVAGGIYLATQMWFFNKLRMSIRLQAAGEILNKIRATSEAVILATNTKQIAAADEGLESIKKLGLILEAINSADVDPAALASIADEIERGVIRVSVEVQELITTSSFLATDRKLRAVATPLFEIDNLLGIKAISKEVQATSVLAQTVTKAAGRKALINKLTPKLISIYTASVESSKLAGASSSIARFSQAAGVTVGKILLVDTVIWGITLGIDLGLNLFMSEEEQANLPIIGFLFKGAGWSPIGAALEWVIINTVELFVGEETAQSLYELFVVALISASQAPLISDMFEIILSFYVNEINGELLTPLEFEGFDLDLGFNPFQNILRGNPVAILEWAFYLITIKVVLKYWLIPVLKYSMRAVKGEAVTI